MILKDLGFLNLIFLEKNFGNYQKVKYFIVTCPTEDLHKNLINLNNFRKDKISVLLDPVINLD